MKNCYLRFYHCYFTLTNSVTWTLFHRKTLAVTRCYRPIISLVTSQCFALASWSPSIGPWARGILWWSSFRRRSCWEFAGSEAGAPTEPRWWHRQPPSRRGTRYALPPRRSPTQEKKVTILMKSWRQKHSY